MENNTSSQTNNTNLQPANNDASKRTIYKFIYLIPIAIGLILFFTGRYMPGIVVFIIGLLIALVMIVMERSLLTSQVDIIVPVQNVDNTLREIESVCANNNWFITNQTGVIANGVITMNEGIQFNIQKDGMFNSEVMPVLSVACEDVSETETAFSVWTSSYHTKNMAIVKAGLLAKMRDTVINTIIKNS